MRTLLLIVAILISYGSLYPFGFHEWAVGLGRVDALLATIDPRTHRGNFIANVVLFVPFGFLTVLVAAACRHRLLCGLAWAVGGLALAVALQVAQLWIPGRNPELGDAVINALGLALGLAVGLMWMTLAKDLPGGARHGAAMIPLALAATWVVYRWYPLVPTLDLQNVKNAFKPLLVSPELNVPRLFTHLVAWSAWMWLLIRSGLFAGRSWLVGLSAVSVVLLQPLFVSGSLSVSAVAGLGLALCLLPWLRHYEAGTVVILMLLAALLVEGLRPFTFNAYPREFLWLPFAGFLGGSMELNLLNLFEKVFLYGALIYAMRANGLRWGTAGLIAALWLGMIEGIQVWLPGRTPEITDPLLALMLAYAMSRVKGQGVGARPSLKWDA